MTEQNKENSQGGQPFGAAPLLGHISQDKKILTLTQIGPNKYPPIKISVQQIISTLKLSGVDIKDLCHEY